MYLGIGGVLNILESQIWMQDPRYIPYNDDLDLLSTSDSLDKSSGLVSLLARSVSELTATDSAQFFRSQLSDLHDPYLFQDMSKACDLIVDTIHAGGRLLIYGDYDADGLTSTALLLRFFRALDVDVTHMIPDRLLDGYGIVSNKLDEIIKMSPDLLITVDCGIANIAEVAKLTEAGIPVIVTDHHEAKEELPEALAIINPTVDRNYPFSGLAGVGVALKLVSALREHAALRESFPDFEQRIVFPCYLVLAAIGTVADSMTLLDENRSIVSLGLKYFNEYAPLGLRLLLSEQTQTVDARTIAFFIAPRLNAAGRMGDLEPAVKLLISEDRSTCLAASEELENLNNQRKELESYCFEAAVKKIKAMPEDEKQRLIVVEGEDWHIGILGIVSSKLVSKYSVSVMVFSRTGDNYRGSCRSYQNFNILEILNNVADLTETFGGHKMAAGVEVSATNYHDFRKEIIAQANVCDDEVPTHNFAFELPANFCNLALADQLQTLEPYGRGNEEPVFYVKNLKILEWRPVGNGEHISLTFVLPTGGQLRGIWFKGAEYGELYRSGDSVDILAYLKYQVWNNYEQAQFQIVAMRPPFFNSVLWDQWQDIEESWLAEVSSESLCLAFDLSDKQLKVTLPQIIAVLSYYRDHKYQGKPCDCALLTRAVIRHSGVAMTPFILNRCVDILTEAGLINCRRLNGEIILHHKDMSFAELVDRLSTDSDLNSKLLAELRDTKINQRLHRDGISQLGI